LTKPAASGGKSFQEALANLRTNDRFTGMPIDKNTIGQLAWAGLGNRVSPGIVPVTPSPLESPFPTQIFVVANDGVFYYQPINHSLEQIAEGDARINLATATAMPAAVSNAGCVMIITSNITRNAATRGSTGTTSNNNSAMLLEAGHIAQNIQLQAACLEGLGSVTISVFEESNVSQICKLPRGYDVLYMVCVGFTAGQDNGNSSGVTAKKAALIVPSENFHDDEFWQTKAILESARILVTVASNRLGPIRGMNASLFEVSVTANQIKAEDFDAIIVIGGLGAAMFNNDIVVRNLLQDASRRRKIIGATSYGTAVLASAGILQGIKVACPVDISDDITRMGAVYSNALIEENQRVITCAGSQVQVLQNFAASVADRILGK
jgi:protease I